MKRILFCVLSGLGGQVFAADAIQFCNTYRETCGETKTAVAFDPAKDLPYDPAVEPKDAIATWKVKAGFKLQLAANEPPVRDPIAVSFDENGRMFVGEMIDYSEMRDVKPHLGRISVLEDKDGDGRAEVREKVFTGFGSGLERLNGQALMNSPQWGQDNRIHIQSGSGNRGNLSLAYPRCAAFVRVACRGGLRGGLRSRHVRPLDPSNLNGSCRRRKQ